MVDWLFPREQGTARPRQTRTLSPRPSRGRGAVFGSADASALVRDGPILGDTPGHALVKRPQAVRSEASFALWLNFEATLPRNECPQTSIVKSFVLILPNTDPNAGARDEWIIPSSTTKCCGWTHCGPWRLLARRALRPLTPSPISPPTRSHVPFLSFPT